MILLAIKLCRAGVALGAGSFCGRDGWDVRQQHVLEGVVLLRKGAVAQIPRIGILGRGGKSVGLNFRGAPSTSRRPRGLSRADSKLRLDITRDVIR